MKNNTLTYALALVAVTLVMASCGTKKNVVSGQGQTSQTSQQDNLARQKRRFVQQVYDNAVYAKNITSKIKFSIATGGKDFSVSGSLHMRKDDVIRIQLTPLGLMEAARIEFTKDYVLIVDRLHKEYIKEDYGRIDFLRDNGLDFYALQALLWNELYVPGQSGVSDALLGQFDVTLGAPAGGNTIALERGKMSYVWTADAKAAQITGVDVAYAANTAAPTRVKCTYGQFKAMGSKRFPTQIALSLSTRATGRLHTATLGLQLNNPDNDANWEPRTSVSSKYKKVAANDILNRLSSL